MQRKQLTVKKVLTMGVVTGITVIVIAYFAIYTQQKRLIAASKAGTLPMAKPLTDLHHYVTDHEGTHHYAIERENTGSKGTVRVWSRLLYTDDGKKAYILKRRQRNIFVDGFDKVTHRDVLYELKCTEDPAEYAIIEVFEVNGEGKTIDYGRSGSSRDWEAIPEGTTIEKLAKAVCPTKSK